MNFYHMMHLMHSAELLS